MEMGYCKAIRPSCVVLIDTHHDLFFGCKRGVNMSMCRWIAIAAGMAFMCGLSGCSKPVETVRESVSEPASVVSQEDKGQKPEIVEEKKEEKKGEEVQPEAEVKADVNPIEEGVKKDVDVKKSLEPSCHLELEASSFAASDSNWEKMHLDIRSFPDSADEEQKEIIYRDVSRLLRGWNRHRNEKDAGKLAGLYAKECYIRGEALKGKEVAGKLKKSFEKHSDYSQIPGVDVRVNFLRQREYESVETWSVQFMESFTQDGKTSDADILLILSRKISDDVDSDWRIVVETDAATDRNMMKKLGMKIDFSPKTCRDLALAILAESPMIREEVSGLYEAALVDMKKKTLAGIVLEEPDDPALGGDGVDADAAKAVKGSYSFVLYEEHLTTKEEEEETGRTWYPAVLGRYVVDLEEKQIVDEIFESIYPIEEKYQDAISCECRL